MTNQKPLARIALVGDSLGGGGAEKIHATLSHFLTDRGLTVVNIIFLDRISYDFAGELINLGKVAAYSGPLRRKWRRFAALRKLFGGKKFDAVVDFRMRPSFLQEWLLQKFAYPDNVFYTVHSSVLRFYFPSHTGLSRILYRGQKLIAVSEGIAQKIRRQRLAENVSVIHNLFDLERIAHCSGPDPAPEDYILAVGRMNDGIKQFDRLIECYARTDLAARGIRLVLLGEGENLEQYRKLAVRLGLAQSVEFMGFVENPYPVYAKARFLVLCSKNEGFPNVLVEALASGTPVVSFDCETGPGEIILHGQNGMLVPDQDFEALAKIMEELPQSAELETMRVNARVSVTRFSVREIGPRWLSVLKIDVS